MQQTSGSSSCNTDGAEPAVEVVAGEEVPAVFVSSLLMVCGNCDRSICPWLNGGGSVLRWVGEWKDRRNEIIKLASFSKKVERGMRGSLGLQFFILTISALSSKRRCFRLYLVFPIVRIPHTTTPPTDMRYGCTRWYPFVMTETYTRFVKKYKDYFSRLKRQNSRQIMSHVTQISDHESEQLNRILQIHVMYTTCYCTYRTIKQA